MGWEGTWNDDHTVFTGSYTFDDGAVFTGKAEWVTQTYREVPWMGARMERYATGDCEPHWQFTGTWEKDGGAYAPLQPPAPE